MTRLERGSLGLHAVGLACLGLASGLGSLLAEPDDLLAPVRASFDDVRLGRVARGALGLVAGHCAFVDSLNHHLLLAARMLSTRFGYGRPAALADALALAFLAGESLVGLPSEDGRDLSQMGFAFLGIAMLLDESV